MSRPAEALGVFVNDQPRELLGPATLLSLMKELGQDGRTGIAAAVNAEVVPRSAWATRSLAGGDRVLVIRATQGG